MDDQSSWDWTRGATFIDGFSYSRLLRPQSENPETHIHWLLGQREKDLSKEFRPQPWEQVSAVLRETGYTDAARTVALAKHRAMRRAGRYVGGSRLWDWIYGTLVGYGYRPWTLLRVVAIVWAACTLIYWPAANPRLFGAEKHLLVPASGVADTACLLSRAAAGKTEPCEPKKPRYEDLFLPAFSAEVLIPVVSLGQKGEWRPRVSDEAGRVLYWGWVVRTVYWFEIFFGWLASLLLIAAVGNLIKKE